MKALPEKHPHGRGEDYDAARRIANLAETPPRV